MDGAGTGGHRYAVLDTYRFLAASAVVFYHFEAHFGPFLPPHAPYLDNLQYCVDFFFVLSGFVIACTYGDRVGELAAYGRFLRKRFARLYPLHLATVALACLIGAAAVLLHMKVRDASLFDYGLVPANLLLLQAWGVVDRTGLNGPSWSISAEVFAYLLFPLLAVALRRIGPALALFAVVAVAALIEAVRAHLGLGPNHLATYDFGTLRAVPPFFAGMAVFAIVDRLPAKPMSWAWSHLLALAIVALMLAQAPAYSIIALFPLLVGLVSLAERGGLPTVLAAPAFVLLGNASYAIYMIHTFFQVAAVSVMRALHLTTPVELGCVAAATYGLILLAGVASYRWFETPMRRLLTGLSPFPRRPPTPAHAARLSVGAESPDFP